RRRPASPGTAPRPRGNPAGSRCTIDPSASSSVSALLRNRIIGPRGLLGGGAVEGAVGAERPGGCGRLPPQAARPPVVGPAGHGLPRPQAVEVVRRDGQEGGETVMPAGTGRLPDGPRPRGTGGGDVAPHQPG